MNPLRALGSGLKRADNAIGHAVKSIVSGGIRFSGRSGYGSWPNIGASSYNFQRSVGDPATNGILAATIRWMQRTYVEAPLRLMQVDKAGEKKQLFDHPLAQLLRQPNAWYSSRLLWSATIADFALTGNAYWIKVRGPGARVVQLYWVPSHLIEPRWPDDETTYISHYDYKINGLPVHYPPEDVIHFRDGIDPNNQRKGLGPVGAIMREIATDNEAANMTASLLRNMGVPGVVIAPAASSTAEMSPDEADQIKTTYMQKFGGDHKGEPMIMGAPTNVSVLSWSPQQMNLDSLRRVPEERISAALGIPAIVVGLGVGIAHCLPADTRIWTTGGAVNIGRMQSGAVVWSYVDGRLEPRRVVRQWQTGVRQTYTLRTKNRTIRATGNHPFLVREAGGSSGGSNEARRSRCVWRRLDELKPGDQVVQPKSLPDQGATVLPDGRPATAAMLQFFGAIIGDGTVSPGVGVRMAMPPADRCVDTYRDLAVSLFSKYSSGGERPWKRANDGRTERIVEMVGAGQSYHAIGRAVGLSTASVRDRYLIVTQPKPVVVAPVRLNQRERDFGFSSAEDSRWLATLGLSGRALSKRVPSWVYGLSRDLRLAFLAGIVDSDGSIDKRGCMSVGFANEALTHDVRDLLISCGIQCSNVEHRTMGPEVLPNPGVQEIYHVWRFTASSAVQIAAIPFADPVYRERVNANAHRFKSDGKKSARAGLHDGFGFYTIRSIEPSQVEPVYDIEVEGGHSFIANGLLVHNSTYSNYETALMAAYTGNVIPTQGLFADELQTQLVGDFDTSDTLQLEHDYSDVRVLQADLDSLYKRAVDALNGGLITLNTALVMIGEEPEKGDVGDIRYISTRITPMLADDLMALREMPARVTVTDAGTPVQLPQQRPDPFATVPLLTEPAKLPEPFGGKSARVRAAVGKRFEPGLADAVLAVLGDEHEGVSAAEHAETVIRQAQEIARAL